MNNFFSLFEQVVAFDIDQKALDETLYRLQKQYHPDNLANTLHLHSKDITSESINPESAQSALINHGYQTLKHLDTRAVHLLELTGQTINFNQSISDLDFLDSAMDIRMALDDFLASQQLNKLLQLKTDLQQHIEIQSNRFKKTYQEKNWQLATDATQKLKFLVKIDKDIDSAIDEVAQSQTNETDDDLYV